MSENDVEKDADGLIIERDIQFVDGTVVIDGHHFINCLFHNCELVYGGGPYRISNTPTPEKCDLALSGSAALVMDLLKWLKVDPSRFDREAVE